MGTRLPILLNGKKGRYRIISAYSSVEDFPISQPGVHPVAIVLDLVRPVLPCGRFFDEARELRLDPPWWLRALWCKRDSSNPSRHRTGLSLPKTLGYRGGAYEPPGPWDHPGWGICPGRHRSTTAGNILEFFSNDANEKGMCWPP
jgi:hypothetical protein